MLRHKVVTLVANERQKSRAAILGACFALWMNEGNVMASGRYARIQRLEQRLEDAEYPWLASRGLASLLRYDMMHSRPDTDPLAGYVGDGSDLVGLAQLLFYPSLRAESD